MATEKIETYPQAARVIHLWLKEFCDESKPYPEMIADASRRAAKEIEKLRDNLGGPNVPNMRQRPRPSRPLP